MGIFKDIFKTTTLGGDFEKNLLIAAGILGAGYLAGPMMAGSAAAGSATGAGAAGAGAAAEGAGSALLGESLLGGLGAGGGMGIGGAELATPGISSLLGSAGGSTLLGGLELGGMGLGGAELATPGIESLIGGAPSFAGMNTAGGAGGAGAFGLSGADAAASKPWLSGRQAMMLGQMAGNMGGESQRPISAPPDLLPPMAQRQMATQAEITKAWLLKNDPATYARMYGPPPGAQGGMYG